MRKEFATVLLSLMEKDKSIFVVTGDLGYGMFDAIREKFPNRFFNVGAAEQTMMGVAVGLSLKGKKVIVYSITPFLLYRAFETIRNYINHEKIPVILVGSGRDKDYAHDGFSHHSEDDGFVKHIFSNIKCFWPTIADEACLALELSLEYLNQPVYINLKR